MTEQNAHHRGLFDDFIERTKLLTAAERNVFLLYFEGKTASEISKTLFISINTVKTHTRRIFDKLGVSTREEIALYATLMKKSGNDEAIHIDKKISKHKR